MAYKTPDGLTDRPALATDARLYDSLFTLVDAAEASATAAVEHARDREVKIHFAKVRDALREMQFTHLVDGARLIIEPAQDEAGE